MRIIAGDWRGRTLIVPAGKSTRPTADRTRETLFSMLASRLGGFEELAVADLYAGSGALGLEALSRGAASCVFVENDRSAVDAIKQNVAKLGAGDCTHILPGTAERLASGRAFDLILADPPYRPGSGDAVVKSVTDSGWLSPGGWLAIETDHHDEVDPVSFTMEAQRVVGRARLHLLYSSP